MTIFHKTRLDQYALKKFPTLSRSYVARLIEEGRILVNDEPSKPGYRLREKDKVKIDFDPQELDHIPHIDLPIIYEDDDVLVIDKPAGVISHARGRYWNEPSVASFVRQHLYGTTKPFRLDGVQGAAEQQTEPYKQYGERAAQTATQQSAKSPSGMTGSASQQAGAAKMFGDRAGIVHRLDRATSGVMITAKNQVALSWLQKQFSSRKVVKTYTAIVEGHLSPKEAVIDMPIERNPKHPQTFRVGINGKSAITKYKVSLQLKDHDVVELKPETGRTHQLRVHLRQLGHPIVGDQLYGGEASDRLYLHAHQLEVKLPNGQLKLFTASVPGSFKKLIKTYG